jgi:hypothetical protein
MSMTNRTGGLALGVLAVVASAFGADAPTKTIEAGGIKFEVPETWKSSPPASQMRLAQLAVGPAKGDSEPAELVIFAFPGGAGSVEANLERWQQQFLDKEGNPPKITTEKRKGANVDVTYAECSGRYVAAMQPGSPKKYDKPNYRLLGAIVQTPQVGYFLKMVGPDATMKEAKPAFDGLIRSIKVDAK